MRLDGGSWSMDTQVEQPDLCAVLCASSWKGSEDVLSFGRRTKLLFLFLSIVVARASAWTRRTQHVYIKTTIPKTPRDQRNGVLARTSTWRSAIVRTTLTLLRLSIETFKVYSLHRLDPA